MNLLTLNIHMRYGLRGVLLVAVFFLFVFQGNGFAQAKDPALTIGQAGKIKSKVLGEELKLFVYLPEGYETSSKRCPVLYHFYEENLIYYFHYSTGITRFLSRARMIPPMIVVAVQVDGMRDLTPSKTPDYGPRSGGSDNYIKFLKEELIPYIDKTYRTEPFRIIWGHSIVGTLCIYTLLSAPEVFNAYITSSPYFIYDRYEGFLLKNAAKFLKRRSKEENFLFITVGNESDLVPSIEQFIKILNTMKPVGLKWEYHLEDKEDHTTNQALVLERGLKILYSHK